jgi:hypothetical protein
MSVITYKETMLQCPQCQASVLASESACTSCGTLIPVIRKFTSKQQSIRLRKAIVLEWEVTGADRVIISPDVGEVEAAGWTDVYPTANTTYTISALSGAIRQEATLTFLLPTPEIHYFAAAETEIDLNYPTILHWDVENAETIHIDRGIGDVSGLSFREERLTEPGTYTLTAVNASGSTTETLTLTMALPAITLFAAGNEVIRPGTASLLMWDAENAEKLFIEPEIGEVTGSIRWEVFPDRTTTYTLLFRGQRRALYRRQCGGILLESRKRLQTRN